MDCLQAFILGLIQGLTEYLPVSSSGHLAIGSALFGLEDGEANLTFTIAVHVATVLSTLVILWKEIVGILKGTLTTMKWNAEKDYLCKIVLSMVPIFVVGMFFKDQVEAFFGNGLILVGICLFVTAALLFLSETLSKRTKKDAHEVRYVDAIIIGLAQAVAVLPGLSRSGTTIATGLLCGVKKDSTKRS